MAITAPENPTQRSSHRLLSRSIVSTEEIGTHLAARHARNLDSFLRDTIDMFESRAMEESIRRSRPTL